MESSKRAGVFFDPTLIKQIVDEIDVLNRIADTEYLEAVGNPEKKKGKKAIKPKKLTIKSYGEAAILYFLRNHIDPRNMGEEKDVLTEVRKLRNNVFSFMQVQERTYLMPFVQDVYDLRNRADTLEDTSFDMLNLMEIFIDLLLAGLGLSEQEQEAHKARAAKMFTQKKVNRKPKKA